MSFFYGVNSTTVSNSSNTDPLAQTILPGYNFKDPYMTAVVILVGATIVLLTVACTLCSRTQAPPDQPPVAPAGKEGKKKHPTEVAPGFFFWYLLYFVFELIIRICVELRLEVPYAFIAIDIPARLFLMFGDFVAWWAITSIGRNMRRRLGMEKKDRFYYFSTPVVRVGLLTVGLTIIAERILYIVMMVGQGFRWAQPDKTYYAISRLIYTTACLLLTLQAWASVTRTWIVYRKQRSTIGFVDNCGKIPFVNACIMAPVFNIRTASAFFYTLYFRFQKRPQHPHLELPRMLMLCVPVIVVGFGFWQVRKLDRDIKYGVAEREYKMDHQLQQQPVATVVVQGPNGMYMYAPQQR